MERDDITAISIPCGELAEGPGEDLEGDYAEGIDTTKALNCIMCGAFLARPGWDSEEALSGTEDTFTSLYQASKARFVPLNLAGVRKGFDFLNGNQRGNQERATA